MRYILKKLKIRYASRFPSVRKRVINQMQVTVTYSDGRVVEGTTNKFETYDDLEKFLKSGPSIVTIPTTSGGILVDINNVLRVEGRFSSSQSFTTIFSNETIENSVKDVIISELDLDSLLKTTQEDTMADKKTEVATTETKVDAQTLPDEIIDKATRDFVSFRDNFLDRANYQKPFMNGIIEKMKKRGELIDKADKMLTEHIADLENMIKTGE